MPSRRELAQATGLPATAAAEVAVAARSLIERCGFGAVYVLLGRDGAVLVEPQDVTVIGSAPGGDGYDPGGVEDAALAVLPAGLRGGVLLPMPPQLAALAPRTAP